MTSRLTLLGTKGGPAIRPGGPSPTSSLLELAGRRIVVDCGLGVARDVEFLGRSGQLNTQFDKFKINLTFRYGRHSM